MPLTQADLEANPHALPILRERARQLLALHIENPRSAGIFATHQRWLLAHIGIAAQFENALATGKAGMHAAKVATLALESGVSSRNTAEAFLHEMVAYGFVASSPDPDDQRIRWLVVTEPALADVAAWLYGNLATLDAFDQGERAKTFMAARNRSPSFNPSPRKDSWPRPTFASRARRSVCLTWSTRAAR